MNFHHSTLQKQKEAFILVELKKKSTAYLQILSEEARKICHEVILFGGHIRHHLVLIMRVAFILNCKCFKLCQRFDFVKYEVVVSYHFH